MLVILKHKLKLLFHYTDHLELNNSSKLIPVVSSSSIQTSHDRLHQNTFSNNMSTHNNTSMYQMDSNYEYSGLTFFFILYELI